MAKITVKRIVPMFTIVTDKFKKDLVNSSTEEIKTVDSQINALQNQIKQLQGPFGLLSGQSAKMPKEEANRAVAELNTRLEQVQNLKKRLLATMEDIKNKPVGAEIQTGTIESFVDLKVGDNIRKMFESAKIVIKDDVIQEIIE